MMNSFPLYAHSLGRSFTPACAETGVKNVTQRACKYTKGKYVCWENTINGMGLVTALLDINKQSNMFDTCSSINVANFIIIAV